MSQIKNMNPNISKEQFRQYIKEYVGINSEIIKLNLIIKELKNKKSKIEGIVKGGMMKFECEEISFKDGSCMKKSSRNKTIPLNNKWVCSRLSELFHEKNEDEIKQIADFLCNIKYRKTDEVIESVKIQKPKKKRVSKSKN